MYNPCIRGWITYYSHFYKTQLRPTLKRIDAYVIRWARRKFKRMRHQTKGARDWLDRLRRATPRTLPIGRYVMATAEHREPCVERFMHGSGAPEVRVPRATRQHQKRRVGHFRWMSAYTTNADMVVEPAEFSQGLSLDPARLQPANRFSDVSRLCSRRNARPILHGCTRSHGCIIITQVLL